MKFLIDKELNLKIAGEDLLSTESYADTLKEIILASPDSQAFTIGLFGEWGSGKSSIIRTTKEELEKVKDTKIKIVVYDAWKYANDSFRRMFLLTLHDELKFEGTELFNSFYTNKNSEVSYEKKLNWYHLIPSLLILFVGFVVLSNIDSKHIDAKVAIGMLVPFLAILFQVLNKAYNELKVTVQKPSLFAPEQFEDCFNEVVSKSLKQYSFLEKTMVFFRGEKHVKGLNKLVIVIDNIDRCHKELAYELLTNIKNFLSNKKSLVFIIPVDDEALKRFIIKDGNDHKEADEFLRKFFNLSFRIKPFKSFDLYDFASSINIKNGLGLSPTTIDIVSKEYVTNPRRIIQFFNNLSSDLYFFSTKYGDEFVVENESLICKILIIREEWPEYYKEIFKTPSLLNDQENMPVSRNSELMSFLRITDSINQNSSLETIEKILTACDRNAAIPAEVLSAINKKEIGAILDFLNNKLIEKSKLVHTLIEMLNTGIKRKTFATDVSNIFEILCELNDVELLENEHNRRIYQEIFPVLNFLVRNISNLDIFCGYANSIQKQYPYLDRFVLKTVSQLSPDYEADEVSSRFWHKLFVAYITNTSQIETLDTLANTFAVEYEKDLFAFNWLELSSEKLRKIVKESLISKIVEKIITFERTDLFCSDLLYLATRITFTEPEFKKILEKLNILYPTINDIDHESIVDVVNRLNSLFGNKQLKAESAECKELLNRLYHIFIEPRSMNGAIRKIILDLANEHEIEIVVKFIVNIYRISDGAIDITAHLEEMISNNMQTMNIVDMLLTDSGHSNVSMSSLKKIILSDNSFTKENLALTARLIVSKNGDKYILSDSEVADKLTRLLDAAISSNNEVIGFLDENYNDERVIKTLSEIIQNLEKNNILLLSNKLQNLVFDKVAEDDNIFDYEDEINFLKTMARSDKPSHVSKVVGIIISKLQRQGNTNEALDILEEIQVLNNSDSDRIRSQIDYIQDLGLKQEGQQILDKNKETSNSLRILKAQYGSPQKRFYITRIIKKMIFDGQLTIRASNDICGDSHPGIRKALEIDYAFEGQVRHINTFEGDPAITIP